MEPARSRKPISTPRVREQLSRLQASVRRVLAEIPDLGGARPVDIASVTGIDLKLAWKLARIAQSGDPFATVRHLPGAAGWRIAVAAMAKAGASEPAIKAANTAFESAIDLGIAWAGDRKALEIMAAGLASGSDMHIDVEHRRQLYLGGSYVWGVRAQLALRADIIGPGRRKSVLDCVTMRGFTDVERMRSDTPWQIEAPFVVDDHGAKPGRLKVEPVQQDAKFGADAAEAGLHLLGDFCSENMPEVRPAAPADARRSLEFADTEMGTEGRFSIFHGTVLRDFQPARRSARHTGSFHCFKQRTPAERAVFDLAIHQSVVDDDAQVDAILYSDLQFRPTLPYRAKDRIPAGIEVENLGRGLRRAKLPNVPRHTEMLALGFERVGWDPSEFTIFRAELAYPPVPSMIALELPLKDK